MLNVSPIFNRSKRLRKDGRGKVHIRYIYERKPYYYDTKILITPRQWKKGKVTNHADYIDLNEHIAELILRSERYYRQRLREGAHFSVKDMIAHLDKKDTLDLIQFIKVESAKDSETLSEHTIKKRTDLINKMTRYKPTIPMNEVRYRLMVGFKEWLQDQDSLRGGKISNNYIHSLFVLLKKYVREAMKQGHIIGDDPFKGFTIQRTAKVPTVLSENELEILYQYVPDSKRLERIKWRVLFLFFTGMRIGDSSKIREEHFADGMLKFVAGKTKRSKGKLARVPLHLFDYRAYDIFKDHGPFKVVHNYEFNNGFRELLQLAGIDKYMTAHDARHTFKSIMLERGYPIHIIAEMMAHSDTSTTAKYGSISDAAIIRPL